MGGPSPQPTASLVLTATVVPTTPTGPAPLPLDGLRKLDVEPDDHVKDVSTLRRLDDSCGKGCQPSPQPTASPVPTASPTPLPTPVPTITFIPTATQYEVSTFLALSDAICTNAQINVVSDITFMAAITISGNANLKISSSTGAVLSSDRGFSVDYGGMFYIDGGSDVTFTGLGFTSGSAANNGGCLYATGSSAVEVEDVEFTSCSARVRDGVTLRHTTPHHIPQYHAHSTPTLHRKPPLHIITHQTRTALTALHHPLHWCNGLARRTDGRMGPLDGRSARRTSAFLCPRHLGPSRLALRRRHDRAAWRRDVSRILDRHRVRRTLHQLLGRRCT